MTTTKDRIAHALYVLGCLVSLLFLLWLLVGGIALMIDFESSEVPGVLLLILLVVVSYGAGWGLRWVITGNSSSVLDRFK